MAAVIARCSGDKSDKEESAGGFRCYGDCVLQVQPWLAGRVAFIALMIAVAAVFTAYFCPLAFFPASIGLFCWLFCQTGRTDWSGVCARKNRARSLYHAASSLGGARDWGSWPRKKVSMIIIAPPHLGHV